MLTVQTADIKDWKTIARLSRQTFIETYYLQNTQENMDIFLHQYFNDGAIKGELQNPHYRFLLVVENDQPIAYAKLHCQPAASADTPANSLEICRIYNVKEAIGKGVGSFLMNACIKEALLLGKTCVWLGVWEKNKRAYLFYKKHGFQQFGQHVFMLGNDAQTDWLMKRDV